MKPMFRTMPANAVSAAALLVILAPAGGAHADTPVNAPEAGIFLRVTPPVYHVSANGKKGSIVQPFDALHPNDRFEIDAGGKAELVFHQTGLTYDLLLPESARTGDRGLFAVSAGGGDLTTRPPAGGQVEVLRRPRRTLSRNVSASLAWANRFAPAPAVTIGRDPRQSSVFAIHGGVDDAVENADADAVIRWEAIESLAGGRRCLVAIYPSTASTLIDQDAAPDMTSPTEKIADAAYLAYLDAQTPTSVIPAGTLRDGGRYRWIIRWADTAPTDPPLAAGPLRTLSAEQRTSLDALLAALRNEPSENSDEAADHLLLEARAYGEFGLWSRAADHFRAALALRPDPVLAHTLAPLLARPAGIRPAAVAAPPAARVDPKAVLQ